MNDYSSPSSTTVERSTSSALPQPLHVSELALASPDAQIVGAGLVQHAQLKQDRTGRPYVALTVIVADGSRLEARWWRFPYSADRCPSSGTVYRFTGQVETFQGAVQLRVSNAEALPGADLSPFVRATQRPLADLQAELQALIAGLDADLAALLRAVLARNVYERFCTWPAAQSHHGAVRRGLLAHSVRVAHIAVQLGDAYGAGWLPHDKDLVIAAALLHDVGKLYTLPSIAGGSLPEEARQFDHVTLGTLIVRMAAEQAEPKLSPTRLNALLHALLAHHGKREWGAPVEPQSVEAWLVHLADLAEARLWEWSGEAEQHSDKLPTTGEKGNLIDANQ